MSNDALRYRIKDSSAKKGFLPDGSHMRFEWQRSKEVFAYLVHRQGKSCTTGEIAATLFEDEPFDIKQKNHIQQLISIPKILLHSKRKRW